MVLGFIREASIGIWSIIFFGNTFKVDPLSMSTLAMIQSLHFIVWYNPSKVKFEFWRKISYRLILHYWAWLQIKLLDRAKILPEDSTNMCLCWGKLLGELKFRKDLWYRSEQAVWIFLFTSFWLVDFLFGKNHLFTRMWEHVLGIF